MITVKNTKELENKYDLNKIPDDERILVWGGLDKPKYKQNPKYKLRATYLAGQLKQIINEMKLIEREVKSNWSDLQKVKYIYERLGMGIDIDRERKYTDSQQASNLSIILNRKGICAGYALLFKEMMDRQGIPCDYIRGVGGTSDRCGIHAWNVVKIDDGMCAVDLTWDSIRFRNGNKDLKWFANRDFFRTHIQDIDEKIYNYTYYNKDTIKSMEIEERADDERSTEYKKSFVKSAIRETYIKYAEKCGEHEIKQGIAKILSRYIQEGNANVFTRNNNARQGILEHVSREDMLDVLIDSYVRKSLEMQLGRNNQLSFAIGETARKYGIERAKKGLKGYISSGRCEGFTRDNNARRAIKENVTPEEALSTVIENMANDEILELRSERKKSVKGEKKNFVADEFKQVSLPPEREKSLISKAIDWINIRFVEKRNIASNYEKQSSIRDVEEKKGERDEI